jgi:hypothetical protein
MGTISWITYGYHIMDYLWVPYHVFPMDTISWIAYGERVIRFHMATRKVP